MRSCGFFVVIFTGAALAWGARNTGTVDEAAARVESLAQQSTPVLRTEFRILAAQALKDRHPELAGKFVKAALDDVRSREVIDENVLMSLAVLAPDETIALLPRLKPGSDLIVATAFMRADQERRAAPLYDAAWKKGQQTGPNFAKLFNVLAKEDPDEAKRLFADFLASYQFENAKPYDLYLLSDCAAAVASIAPAEAAVLYERVIVLASPPDFGNNVKPSITAKFQIGSSAIATANSRDTVLVAAGSRLLALAPEKFAKHKAVLAQWDLAGGFKDRKLKIDWDREDKKSSAEGVILERMRHIRDLSDAERSKTVIELARAIQALPAGPKLSWSMNLANLATEGDQGKEAMDAVAAVLGQGIHEGPARAQEYIELAELARYEHARAPFTDPSLDTADAVLALRERVHQEADFTLTGMDGKTYSPASMRGKTVLLNFWATWCPPCRKEMPDMQALYQRFEKKGLVILAVSDEERETVAGFLEKQHYTFPVLLDPGRKTNDAFGVEGIPKSFIFDPEGNLVAQAIDMRTQRQFLELLKQAGLQ
jgi:peroxiredoxin